MKKLLAFDLDGTLAPSKSPAPDRITELMGQLLVHFHLCVISGGKFEQFETQLLANIKGEGKLLTRLHIMPTCGTRYYLFDANKKNWEKIYSEDFTKEEKAKIIQALEDSATKLGFNKFKTYGDQIEDRGSQISWSALGQDIVDELGEEGVKLKEEWDPHNTKKAKLRELVLPKLQEFEVRMGGTTTIDVTKLGIDKAYGMQKLMEQLDITKEEILFFGDKLQEGGNDYPVKAMGIDSLEVSDWRDTAFALQAIIHVV
jgi:phosphomannomutase